MQEGLRVSLGELAGLVRPKVKKPKAKYPRDRLVRPADAREKELLAIIVKLEAENSSLRKSLGDARLAREKKLQRYQQSRYAKRQAIGQCLRCPEMLPASGWVYAVCPKCRSEKVATQKAKYQATRKPCITAGCVGRSATGVCAACRRTAYWNTWRATHTLKRSWRPCAIAGCSRLSLKGRCKSCAAKARYASKKASA